MLKMLSNYTEFHILSPLVKTSVPYLDASISQTQIALTASITGQICLIMAGSCLPSIVRRSFFISLKLTVLCSLEIEGVGFIAHLNTMGIPFVIPPLIPPLLFVSVTTLPSSIRNESLASLPFISAKAKPAPI